MRTSSDGIFNGTPMKMPVAQETSRDMKSKHQPPGVIAKLMGLETLPGHHSDLSAKRSPPKGYSPITQLGTPLRCPEKEKAFLDKQFWRDIYPCREPKECKDVYEVGQQSETKYIKNRNLQRGRRYTESSEERKMAFVRQKFIEAKRLAIDEKLRKSKVFQDAVDVLSSNKELFLKFLHEPNSSLSHQVHELQSPQTKHITVLTPSKAMESYRFARPERKSQKQIKKQTREMVVDGHDKNITRCSPFHANQKPDSFSQQTQIVVLKPNFERTHKNLYGEVEGNEAWGSREEEKYFTQQMQERSSSHHRDDSVMSSVFSNGYIVNENSLDRSENEYVDEGNLSEPEVMSSHSWNCTNRLKNSSSSSSLSHVSHLPESSVCREARKRLSERWTMMASNGSGQEKEQVRQNSSTLGEMLALTYIKKNEISDEQRSNEEMLHISDSRFCGGQDPRGELSCLEDSKDKEKFGEDSFGNLLRSRSIPVSFTANGTRLNVEVVEVPNIEVDKSIVSKEVVKSKSGKLSFKGKLSSLFFSRSKKPTKERPGGSPLNACNDGSLSAKAEILEVSKKTSPGEISDDIHHCVKRSGFEQGLSTDLRGSLSKVSSPVSIGVKSNQGTTCKAALSLAKPETSENQSDKQGQPSPISVLEDPFENEVNSTQEFSKDTKSDHKGIPELLRPLESNLLGKSPPIESIKRTLLRDNASSTTPNPLNPFMVSSMIEEEELFSFIHSLFSASGMDFEDQPGAFFAKWYSTKSPLDPLFIGKFLDMKEEKHFSEAKRRQRRSHFRLIFDFINNSLVHITGYGSDVSILTTMSSMSQNGVTKVWDQVIEMFLSEKKCFQSETGDDNSLAVERMMRKEVVGRGWAELMRLEVEEMEKEIEIKMLEELVEEALVDLTGNL